MITGQRIISKKKKKKITGQVIKPPSFAQAYADEMTGYSVKGILSSVRLETKTMLIIQPYVCIVNTFKRF